MKKWLSYASSSNWLRVIGVGTIILLAAYTLVQQSTRLTANDLPLATAEAARYQLASGKSAQSILPPTITDLRTDSTVFVIVVDGSQKVVASSATLDNNPNTLPPAGVFNNTKLHGSDSFTWQPESGVRLATEVLTYTDGKSTGYVVAGQSLSQAEHRIDIYGWITLAAWVGILVWATFIPIPSGSFRK